MKSWETLATCRECGAQKTKRKDEYNPSTYLCIGCFRKKRGKELGNKFGKSQQKTGRCRGCDSTIASTARWCIKCTDKRKEHMKSRMTGSRNPVWTGKHVCLCGNKKSPGAAKCRNCSFNSGERSGDKNGRYVRENREYWLECKKSRNTLSGIMRNVCKQLGIQKSKRKTVDMLGYSWKEFKADMESKFRPGMTWANHGEWHIDHVTPVNFFIENNIYDVKLVNSLNNLKPLWRIDNIRKSDNHTKTKLFLIAGPSGSGKTKLVQELNSPLVIDGDRVSPEELVYLTLNKEVVFYTLNVGISSFIKRYRNVYDIKLYAIDITEQQLSDNLSERNSVLTDNIKKRLEYIKSIPEANIMSIDEIKSTILKMLGEK